jgi:hypothetical protein
MGVGPGNEVEPDDPVATGNALLSKVFGALR